MKKVTDNSSVRYPTLLDNSNTLNKKIYIDKQALREIKWYVNHCDFEISGLGKVITDEDGNYIVNKIYLLQQEGSAAETELDDSAVAKLLFESKDDEGSMLFWWHSHVDMDVFWSSTDKETIYQLGNTGMIISSVFNKKGEIRTSVYYNGQGMQPSSFYDNLPLYVSEEFDEEFETRMLAEYEAKVTQDKFDRYNKYGYGTMGYSTGWIDEDEKDWEVWSYYNNGFYDTEGMFEYLTQMGYSTDITRSDVDQFVYLPVAKRKRLMTEFSKTIDYEIGSYFGALTVFDVVDLVEWWKKSNEEKFKRKGGNK